MNRVTLSDSFAAGLLPKRNEGGDKTAFGNALVIAGSPGFTGAPFFSAMTCQRCGAGLVSLAVPSEIHEIESIKLNEVMVKAISCEDSNEAVIAAYLELVGKSDAVLVGPGISVTYRPCIMSQHIWKTTLCSTLAATPA